ncbi:MAG: hypothetical protein U1F76_24185 [Candidatus Competibacteraceae bacterium]
MMPTPIRYLLPALVGILLLLPGPAPAQQKSSKAAFEIDLNQGLEPATATALGKELGLLLQTVDTNGNPASQSAGRPKLTSLNQIIELLRQHQGVAYVVLGRRSEQTPVNLDKVFVVPDVIKVTISGTPPPAAASKEAGSNSVGGEPKQAEEAGDQEPEVSVTPGEPGQPPQVKFHFDPKKYLDPGSQ